MSRAVTAALVSLLEGLTLTDSGLTGSPVALSGRVRVVTPREVTPPEAAPVCYVVLSAVSAERDGIQGVDVQVFEVMAFFSYTAEAEAMLAGGEVLSQMADAIHDGPGTLAHDIIVGGGGLTIHRERALVACYLRITCRTLRG